MKISVLLVEDNEANLRAKKGYLETFGCGPIIGVRDPDAAIHAIRTLPHFDLVVADIDLSEASKDKKSHNKGGVAVARWLKSTRYPAYVAGYSGHFYGDEVTENERAAFDDMVDRSVVGEELDNRFQTWIDEAAKLERSSKLRSLLFEAYAGAPANAGARHIPVVSLDTLIDYDSKELEAIRSDGFKLTLLLPAVDDEIKKAIPLWIRHGDEEVSIEVVGQPYIYANGRTEAEAQDALKALILGYHEDLAGKDADREMGPYVKLMFAFLDELFK